MANWRIAQENKEQVALAAWRAEGLVRRQKALAACHVLPHITSVLGQRAALSLLSSSPQCCSPHPLTNIWERFRDKGKAQNSNMERNDVANSRNSWSSILSEGLIARNSKHPFPKGRQINSLRTRKTCQDSWLLLKYNSNAYVCFYKGGLWLYLP